VVAQLSALKRDDSYQIGSDICLHLLYLKLTLRYRAVEESLSHDLMFLRLATWLSCGAEGKA
jgi:hypothetical protein